MRPALQHLHEDRTQRLAARRVGLLAKGLGRRLELRSRRFERAEGRHDRPFDDPRDRPCIVL